MTVLKTIYLEKNEGLGNALRIALSNSSNELVARMDSDDVANSRRFEKQLDYFMEHPETDIVGGNITEFVGDERNIICQRFVPSEDKKIKSYMKYRCAFNHMTVMYKKSSVDKAGGYRDWFWNEDYYLWIRMMLMNATFANLPDNLVNVRVGSEMSARRGGMKYFRSEAKLQRFMLDNGIITHLQYLYNLAIRFGGEVVATNTVRAKLFKFTRKKVKQDSVEIQCDTELLRKVKYAEYPPFSVATSVYKNDRPEWFDRALESLLIQSVPPNEIVLVVDGPVPDSIQKVIDKYNRLTKTI